MKKFVIATVAAVALVGLVYASDRVAQRDRVVRHVRVGGSDVEAVHGQAGARVDRAAAAAAVDGAVRSWPRAAISVPLVDAAPSVSDVEVDRAAAQAGALVAGPVDAQAGTVTATLSPADLAG